MVETLEDVKEVVSCLGFTDPPFVRGCDFIHDVGVKVAPPLQYGMIV